VDGRLVEQQDARVLGDGHGQHSQLALAQRELTHVAPAQVADAHALDRRVDARSIGRPQSGEPLFVGYASRGDELLDEHRERNHRLARDDRHQPCQVLARDLR